MLVRKKSLRRFAARILENPGITIFLSFLLLQVAGTLLFMLPLSIEGDGRMPFFQALFTSVSAVCVTGLGVHDAYMYLSDFGKAVLLILIQIGALGLMTITTAFFSFFQRKIRTRSVLMAQENTDSLSFSHVRALFRRVFLVTAIFELFGTVVFARHFIPLYGVGRGIFYALFQSVSSFCNAGFDLSGSVVKGGYVTGAIYNENPVIMLTTALLILFGGIGFVAWQDIFSIRKKKKLSVHTKIILWGTLILVAFGTVAYLCMEWTNRSDLSMGTLPVWQRPLSAFFLSCNMRSAGYSSVNLQNLTIGSKLCSVFLMFVGAGPGSVGGGIRITSFFVHVCLVYSELCGKKDAFAGKWSVPEKIARRALTIFAFMLTGVILLTFLLCLFESEAIQAGKYSFLDMLFEATATLSTTGLSTAGTENLTDQSQMSIIPFMFLGRAGTLFITLRLFEKDKDSERLLPDGNILLG